jgi:uncharacterized protein (TIGR02284 family)
MSARPDNRIQVIYGQLQESALSYRVLAEKVREPGLKQLFQEVAASRRPMIDSLSHEIGLDGKEMPHGGSIGGIVDRIWLRVRDSISHPEGSVVLDECQRGEMRLLEHYDVALMGADVPRHVKRVLEGQRSTIRGNITALTRARSDGYRS